MLVHPGQRPDRSERHRQAKYSIFRAVRKSGRLYCLREQTVKLPISLGIADAEMVKFLSALESGKLRNPFDSEVIHFNQLNKYNKAKLLPIIPPLRLQSPLFVKFGIGFGRQEIGNDLIRFTLNHLLYGSLGVLWLRTANDSHSDLDYEAPPFPSRDEAKTLLENFPKRNPFLYKISDETLEEELRNETFQTAELHVRRTNLQREILEAYLKSIRISLGAIILEGWGGSAQEFMVNLNSHEVLAEVYSFYKVHQVDDGELAVSGFSINDDISFDEISHTLYGEIGKLYLEYKLDNFTMVSITSPAPPSRDEAEKAAVKSGLVFTSLNPRDYVKWLLIEKEKLNRELISDLYAYMFRKGNGNVLVSLEIQNNYQSPTEPIVEPANISPGVLTTVDEKGGEPLVYASKYDPLCILWVNRPYMPHQNVDEFLEENAPELPRRIFYRVLRDAFNRGIISKTCKRYSMK